MLPEHYRKLRNKFEDEIGPADWKSLRAHFVRDAIIIVDASLDLIEVGIEAADNKTDRIEAWINGGMLTKPSPEDARVWEKGEIELLSIIVAPFVLVQHQSLTE